MTSTRSQLSNYRQLKLANGDEVMAEIIQWSDETDATLIIRACYKILTAEHPDGYRYYGFRPWMTYCEDPEHLLTINGDQVVGECMPSSTMFEQYLKTVRSYKAITEEKIKAEAAEGNAVSELELNEDDVDRIFSEMLSDSDGNVVSLFPKEKMH